MKRHIFIGVAWPYVNGDLHVGHLAGYLLPADIFARFSRLRGNRVLMVSGSDCYGTPTTVEADKRGVSPQDIVDEYHPRHVKLFEEVGISFDLFTKTATENHQKLAQEFFLSFLAKGYLFKDTREQYYDPKAEKFLPDRYVEGVCPYCGAVGARSDQCDTCGRVIGEGELKEPKSTLSGEPVELKASEHYFFDLKKLQPFIESYVQKHAGQWKEWVRCETEAWLERGLEARAFSRNIEWGVPFPVDAISPAERIDDIEHKRFYVWWEAVMGYYTASREWSERGNGDWKEWWYSDLAAHYYFMGKDNLPFHTMFWPAELHGYDERLHLPDVVSINQFLTLGGKQFSKSRGVTVDSREFVAKHGRDAVRFYLTYIMPEYADTSFGWSDFAEKHNNVLIGNLGNFVNRTLTLAAGMTLGGSVNAAVAAEVERRVHEAEHALERVSFREYLNAVLALSDFGNKYLTGASPWKKEGDEKEAIVGNALFIVLALQLTLAPLLPDTVEKLARMTGVEFPDWKDDAAGDLRDALKRATIGKVESLFEKIEIGKTE